MADMTGTLDSWSTTSASNVPANSAAVGPNTLADNQRVIQAVVRQMASSNTIASASTTDLSTINEAFITVSGVTTITAFGTLTAGMYKWLRFSGALTLTYNATSLILPGAANITTGAGDIALFKSEGSGNWRCHAFTRAASLAATLAGTETLTNKALTNPSITGSVTFTGSGSGNTTVAASAVASGALTLPAATDTLVGKATTDTLTNKTLTRATATDTFGVGGATAAASGAGITFPASQSASTDVNTLDDYEEGTFTPTITSAGGGTPTYSVQVGTYTKIGNRVMYNYKVTLATLGTLAAGNVSLAGLPFTSEATANNGAAVAIVGNALAATATTSLMAVINPGTTVITPLRFTAGAFTILTVADLAGTSTFTCNGNYQV